jgi:hypothetical protein
MHYTTNFFKCLHLPAGVQFVDTDRKYLAHLFLNKLSFNTGFSRLSAAFCSQQRRA